jgi:hypothetical protein
MLVFLIFFIEFWSVACCKKKRLKKNEHPITRLVLLILSGSYIFLKPNGDLNLPEYHTKWRFCRAYVPSLCFLLCWGMRLEREDLALLFSRFRNPYSDSSLKKFIHRHTSIVAVVCKWITWCTCRWRCVKPVWIHKQCFDALDFMIRQLTFFKGLALKLLLGK